MEKTLIEFEPFQNDDGREYLVPVSASDAFELSDSGLDSLLVDVIAKATSFKNSRVRFDAIPLNVANLVALEEKCNIKISQQTIDK